MNAVVLADGRVIAEQPHLADEGGRAVSGCGTLPHDVGRVLIGQTSDQLPQFVAVGVVEVFIGVEPEEPLSGGMAEGFVANQRLLWQPLPWLTTTWMGQRCDLDRVDIWLPTQQPPNVRGPLSLLAKFARSDPPDSAVPVLLGLAFFLTHRADFTLLVPPQQGILRLP